MPKHPLPLIVGLFLSVLMGFATYWAVVGAFGALAGASSGLHDLALIGILLAASLVGGVITWWSGDYGDPGRRLGVGSAMAMLGMLGVVLGVAAVGPILG